MSAVAEMVGNYAEIKRKFRNLQPPAKAAPEPISNPQLLPIVNIWTLHLERLHIENQAFGPVVLPQRTAVRFNVVFAETLRYFAVDKEELLSVRRNVSVVRPRQISMYLAYRLCLKMSLPEVGRRFNKDHTTVLSACRKIKKLIDANHEETIVAVRAITIESGGDLSRVLK